VHAPSGAPIAGATLTFSGPKSAVTRSDTQGNFSIELPGGRYDLAVAAKGYASVTVNTGELTEGAHVAVVLEPADTPKLRTIGVVTVNGQYTLDRSVTPETVIPRSQMDAVGDVTVTQGLEDVPSAIVQHPDAGAPTAPEVVSLRGPDPSEALVMLDGQTLNDGNTGDLDLSEFPVQAFSSIDVTEGLGPMDAEGSNTFGGAVNLVSLRPTQEDHASLSGSLGSYGTSLSWLNATGMEGKLGYSLAGSDFQQAGATNTYAEVYPLNNEPVNCGASTAASPSNCPTLTHLGSSISAMMGLIDLDYNFSQRSDAGFRIFDMANFRDESSALNGVAGNQYEPCTSLQFVKACPNGFTTTPNPTYDDNIGTGNAIFGQGIRAYDAYDRSVLGSGTLLADFYASDNTVSLTGGSGAATPYDVSHDDARYNEALSWGRSFDDSEFAFGGYLRQESLTGQGIDETLSQSIASYFLRGQQQIGQNLRLSGGLYDADYSTFGNTLNWRLGATYDTDPSSVVRFSVGTGFRAPLLIERYYFPQVVVDGKVAPNPGLPPPDANCVVAGQGNPDEKPEHATEYELGWSHLFSPQSNLDVSVYRSNLRDTIENYYPFGACSSPNGFEYEIPINIGNAVYEGTEVRLHQGFPKQHLLMTLSYGLNVAYPYALGSNVSNPTSGGSLVDYEQFLGVPQQQGSATFTWAENGWHAGTDLQFAGKNNSLQQPSYTIIDAAVGKTEGFVDFTVAATNIFNAVSGPFTRYLGGTLYRGVYNGAGSTFLAGYPTDQLFIQPAAIRFAITVHH